MKKVIGSIVIGIFLVPVCLNAADTAAEQTFSSNKEKVSYSIGLDLGKYLTNMKGKVDYELLKQGIDDGFTGAEPKLSEEVMATAQEEFAEVLKAEQEAVMEEMKAKNIAAGQAYLDENKKKDGVVVTESGLQYEILTEGDGVIPKPEDVVKVDYVGTLIDGTEFDSSIKRGEPVTFPVNQVIPGWTEVLQQMKVGSKYRAVIPASLAYGEAGAPPVIEPNSVLVFEIDLLGIEELPQPENVEVQPQEETEEKKSE